MEEYLHAEDRGMLVNAQGSKGILGGVDGRECVVHTEIPQSNFAVAATRDEFSQATTLHVDVGDPLLVLTPNLDHGGCRLQSLVEDAYGTVTKACDEDVTSHLVRCQGRNARSGSCRNILHGMSVCGKKLK